MESNAERVADWLKRPGKLNLLLRFSLGGFSTTRRRRAISGASGAKQLR